MWTAILTTWFSVISPPQVSGERILDAVDQALASGPQGSRVGQIFIIGNVKTNNGVILDELQLYPGARVFTWRMRMAEFRLIRLGLFEVDLKRGIWPRVKVLDSDTEFKDILVEVVEKEE